MQVGILHAQRNIGSVMQKKRLCQSYIVFRISVLRVEKNGNELGIHQVSELHHLHIWVRVQTACSRTIPESVSSPIECHLFLEKVVECRYGQRHSELEIGMERDAC